MANIEILSPFLLSWEGGYVNDPKDHGGATNKGVTLKTWRTVGYDKDGDGDIDADDLKLLTDDEVTWRVLKPYYWDKVQGDRIYDQGIANLLADWAYMSGARRPAVALQQLLGVQVDGVIGPVTLRALHNYKSADELFSRLRNQRMVFYEQIVERDPSQKRFLKGWINRLAAISHRRLLCNGGRVIEW